MSVKNAKAAGAQVIVEKLKRYPEMHAHAAKHAKTYGSVGDYDGSDPQSELDGVMETIQYVHDHYREPERIGWAGTVVRELERRIANAGRHESENESEPERLDSDE